MFGAVSGCDGSLEVPFCPGPEIEVNGRCPPRDCNSPIANGFPINGLAATGEGVCNQQGTQLVPGSLSGGGCGRGADLMLSPPPDGYHGPVLVGKRDGVEVCAGQRLKDARFEIGSHNGASVLFTIEDVQQLEDDGPEAYKITVGKQSACDPVVADSVRAELGLPLFSEPLKVPNYVPTARDELVIAVPGPLYDMVDRTIPGTAWDWFNLACVGDALAKRSLYNLYTEDPGDEDRDSKNETALKVITARYCGDRAFTLRGAPFSASPALTEELEALWHEGRATCLEVPRLLTLTRDGEPVLPCDLPDEVQPDGCGEGACCDPSEWVAALRDECGLQDLSCSDIGLPPPQFESRVYVDGLRVFAE